MTTRLAGLVALGALVLAGSAAAQPAPLLREALPQNPDLGVTMMVYDLPPAGTGPVTTAGQGGHRHPAAVYAYVARGSVVSRLGDAAEKTYKTGEAWSEKPGQAHYIVNASKTEAAQVVVLFVAPAATSQLTEPLAR